MKVSDDFLKAKKRKDLRAMLIFDKYEEQENKVWYRRMFIRLCLDIKSEFNDKSEMVFVECDTDIRYEDYTQYPNKPKDSPHFKVCFNEDCYSDFDSHIRTFLNAINKDSEVHFKIRINNNWEGLKKVDYHHHQLFGYINDRCYFLSDYVGEQNLATPVQW